MESFELGEPDFIDGPEMTWPDVPSEPGLLIVGQEKIDAYREMAARLTTLEAQLKEARQELAEQEVKHQRELEGAGQRAEVATATVSELLREFYAGGHLAKPDAYPFADLPCYMLDGVNAERERNNAWCAMKARELGLPWPLPDDDFEGIAPRPAAPSPLEGEAGPREPWRAVFDTQAEYDASVQRNIERIASGEVKPIEPDQVLGALQLLSDRFYDAGAMGPFESINDAAHQAGYCLASDSATEPDWSWCRHCDWGNQPKKAAPAPPLEGKAAAEGGEDSEIYEDNSLENCVRCSGELLPSGRCIECDYVNSI